MGVHSDPITAYERDIFMVSLFFCAFLLISSPTLSSLFLPLSFSPPYIYVQYFTQSCVNIQVIYRNYLSLSLLLSSLSCLVLSLLSYLSPYLSSNIYYIYNKYPIYISLPYNLYTHDHICSIFIIDYVII